MRYKEKLIILFLLLVFLTGLQFLLPYNPAYVSAYDNYIFRPFQSFRNVLFGWIPLSMGDLLYIMGALVIIATISRWAYFLVKFKTHAKYLPASLLHTVIGFAVVYLVFFLGWGGNYYKQSLTSYWDLDKQNWTDDSALVQYDRYLIEKLNATAPFYQGVRFKIVDKRAQEYYKEFTDSRTKMHGLNAKPSIFGYMMQHLGIQGYYNPFTGEAQVNRFLPHFMLPYVVCHELAHQAGIAAEDDANLLAYAIGIKVKDADFNYSAYFNLWLYTHARLKQVDSNLANSMKKGLNALSIKHVDTLREIRRRYMGDVSDYSGRLYDEYLKLHNQKDGLKSYNKVSASAWAWEQQRIAHMSDTLLRIP